MEADFGETQVLIRLMVDYANMAAKEHALLNRIEAATSEEDRLLLEELSSRNQYIATLLPIRTVGVQVMFASYMLLVIYWIMGSFFFSSRETVGRIAIA